MNRKVKYALLGAVSLSVCALVFPLNAQAKTTITSEDVTYEIQEAMYEGETEIVITGDKHTVQGLNLSSENGVSITFDANASITGSIYGNSMSNITISGGNWTETDFNLQSSSGVTIKNATFSGGEQLLFNTVENLTFDNVTITNTSKGLKLYNCKNASLNKVNVQQTTNDNGILIQGGSASIKDSKVEKSYWVGVCLTSKANVTISGSTISNNGKRPGNSDAHAAGVGVYTGSKLTVIKSTLNSNKGCGIAANGKKGDAVSVTVKGCTISKNKDHGIGGRPYATINVDKYGKKRSVFNNNTNYGVMYHSNCKGSVKNSDFSKNGMCGIDVNESSSVTKISNCTFTKNKQHGILVFTKSSVGTIEKCTFTGHKNSMSAGVVAGTGATIKNIKNCKFKKNGFAIRIDPGGKVKKQSKNKVSK
ncbi:MAG: right-handed parallel beta-helix repeat-containing protein [Lachnospiraceae bacterium]|nr:right-handed parallel beta-helix repeat-containing protein [Lachnospiraceae bacterium]